MRGIAAAAAALAGCAPEPLLLPQGPVAQAATCTAVRALELGGDGGEPLSFAGFTEIMHFAMLAAARGGGATDLRRVMEVGQRAPVLMDELREQDWETLVEPCNAAFPETQREAGGLPPSALEAGLVCFGLADFIARTAADHPQEAQASLMLANRALAAATPALREQAAAGRSAAQVAAGYQSRAFLAGRPETLLAQCRNRFPSLPNAG